MDCSCERCIHCRETWIYLATHQRLAVCGLTLDCVCSEGECFYFTPDNEVIDVEFTILETTNQGQHSVDVFA